MKGHLSFSLAIVIFSHFESCLGTQFQPRVTIENGVVVGYHGTTRSGKTIQKFEGIPYAKPPINGRRFKEPEPLEQWIGEWNATSPGSPCLQYDHYTRRRNEDGDYEFIVHGDEDCLFLNVYTRNGESKNKDVIVTIHGGAFTFGTSAGYQPDYILDENDFVFVTMNYRLGPLGFLTTGDSFIPGNNGLKDQAAALEWVQRNIAAFGGDPSKVTLVGLSAGGVSVHYHFLSPLSKGLFSKGYSYSGTTLCPWAMVKDGPQKTKQLATLLGCPTTDSKTILKCLRRRPAHKIVSQMKNFHSWLFYPFTVFGPVVDTGSARPFLPKTPLEILVNGEAHDLPWISGYTTEDGLYPAADFVDDDRFLEQLNQKWESIASDLVFYSEAPKKIIARKLKEMYLGSEEFSRESVPKIIKMFSDRLFIAPAVKAAIVQARVNSQPVFLYQYGYKGEQSVSRFMSGTNSTFGACHGDDFAYVVKFLGYDSLITKEDEEMSKVLMDILVNFVKTGTPPKSLKWEAVSKKPSKTVKYLNIEAQDRISLEQGADIGSFSVWDKILKKTPVVQEEL